MIMRRIFIPLFFFLLSSSSMAQTTIKGTVTNALTGEPLPGTNVYLAKTTIGNSTNKFGKYLIKTEGAGNFDLVFSFVGFKRKIVPVVLNKKTLIIDVALNPATIQLEELAVTASNKQWNKRFKLFRNEFIGTTEFAEKTKILNPEALRFEINSDGRLVATSVKPLHIINRALGYKIYVELEQFQYALNGIRGFYKIYPQYDLLKPVSQEQQERWEENRRETYLGSLRHFLKKLYYDDVRDTFSLSPRGNINPLSKAETTFKLLGRVPDAIANAQKGFELMNPTVVMYGKFSNQRKSAIGSNTKDHTFFINKNGILLNPLAIRLGGYWSYNRVANALPLNYSLNE